MKTKELTIEEKAKAYDRAIANAKEKAIDGYLDAVAVNDIFPELAESKDEEIRKELIAAFQNGVTYNQISKAKAKDYIAWLEKQGEQKPTDKVETKFHEGDWVILTAGELSTTLQIAKVDTNKKLYWFNDSSYLPIVDEECLHFWTIQDAKEGDVLHSTGFHNDCIFIFNRLDNWKFDEPNEDRVVATGYCCLSISADKMEFGIQGPDCVEVNTIKPATKIQHGLLFQKMKEAGYEWNNEKKELKKIEQKPINIVTILDDYFSNTPKEQQDKDWEELKHLNNFGWELVEQKPADKVVKFNVGDKVYNIKNRFECTIESIDDTTYYCDTTNFDIKDQNNWEIVEKKHTEWSKEDERDFDVIYGIIYNSCNAEDASRLIEWLKSLKDRVQPKSQSAEWSEEDIVAIDCAVEVLSKDLPSLAASIERLKSLRPQNWTKEDKDRYISCLQRLGTGTPEQPETINSKWFKEHVYPQSSWKPSETDIIVLENVIDRGRNPIDYHATLHSILEQLKKLRED